MPAGAEQQPQPGPARAADQRGQHLINDGELAAGLRAARR